MAEAADRTHSRTANSFQDRWSSTRDGVRRALSQDRLPDTALRLAPLAVGGVLVAYGLRRGGWLGWGLALAGAGVLQQSFTGRPDLGRLMEGDWMGRVQGGRAERAITLSHTVTVNRPAEELYRFWRNLENLSQVFSHIETIEVLDNRRSHWRAKAPAGLRVEWESEVTDEQEGRRLAWRATQDSEIPNWGHVEFRPLPGGRGTELHAVVRYEPPAGALGRVVARLFGEEPQQRLREDLARFKRRMEADDSGPAPAGGSDVDHLASMP